MKHLLALLIFISLSAQTIDGIAIMVKDQPITLYEITETMKEHKVPQEQAIDILERKTLEEIEIRERHLTASKQDVFEDIQKMADQNKLSVIQLYQAIESSQGLSESVLKEKIKEKILHQKLYNAIAFSHLEQPSDEEIQEYYKLHKDQFSKPSSFSVLIYSCPDRNHLQEKIDNPMFNAPDVNSQEQNFDANKINPRLAELLARTSVNSFTQIVPSPQGGFMSFYLKEKGKTSIPELSLIRPQISNALMQQKRESILKDYFDRQKLNADIKVIRLPQN